MRNFEFDDFFWVVEHFCTFMNIFEFNEQKNVHEFKNKNHKKVKCKKVYNF